MEISLALGGGGARGIAHLGVLRYLDEQGYQVKALSGTSAGGMIGAVYAAGYHPDEIVERFLEVDQSHLFGRQVGDGPSLLGVAGLMYVLDEMLGEKTFDDLRIPFVVTAVDINSESEVRLKNGRIVDAVLATIAMPGVFPPRVWDEYSLVDGGLLNPVPVLPARKLAPGLPVVAVTLSSKAAQTLQIFETSENPVYTPILRQIARLRVAQAFDIFVNSMNISNRFLTELRLKVDKPDVIIRPEVSEIGMLDKVDIEELVELGEIAAQAAEPQFTRLKNWRHRLNRFWHTSISAK